MLSNSFLKIENSILKTIAYFDMFRYPLTAAEICRFFDSAIAEVDIEDALSRLVDRQLLYPIDEFYSLQNDPSLAEKRRKGRQRADELLVIAHRIGKRLYRFPFVKGVGISGSLSKNHAEPDADIDFFIITEAGYLWVARTLLHLLKKLSFLSGRQDWYCMNYFVDEKAMLISEKNVFTGTEVITLKPVAGHAMTDFYHTNQWAFDLFPNYEWTTPLEIEKAATPIAKKWTEKLLRNRLGTMLDNYLMKITTGRWSKKEVSHKTNNKGEPLGLLAGKHFARPNPEHLQKKLLRMYDERLKRIENVYGVYLSEPHQALRKEII